MSLFRRSVTLDGVGVPSRLGRSKSTPSTQTAMRQSVIWSAMTLRAGVESMLPVDVFKTIDGVRKPMSAPPVLVEPSSFADGHPDTIADWLYAGRMALDGYGNNFGEITARDAYELPAEIQLVPPEDVRVDIKNRRIVRYRFGNVEMEPRRVWHERQYLWPGVPVGLSPIAYAAMVIAQSESAQEFVTEWFGNRAIPSAHLRNTEKIVPGKSGDVVKAKFEQAVSAGGVFVSGRDWTYSPLQAKAAESGFLDSINATAVDLCRFFGVTANIVDVAVTGGATLNYANITQKNLDFLTTRMGPSIKRREDALTTLTPKPRFVKLNRSAFLAMDDKTRAELLKLRIDSRTLTPNQARRFEDEPELVDSDYAEFDRLFGNPNKTTPQKGSAA